jgi:hypothetical protein
MEPGEIHSFLFDRSFKLTLYFIIGLYKTLVIMQEKLRASIGTIDHDKVSLRHR